MAKTHHLIFPFSLRSSSSLTSSEASRARFGGDLRSQEGVKVEDRLSFLSPFLFTWSWGQDPGLKIKSDWGSVNFGPSANETTSFSLPHHGPCLLSHYQVLLFNEVCSGCCVIVSYQGPFPSYPLGWDTGRGSHFKLKHFALYWLCAALPNLGHFMSPTDDILLGSHTLQCMLFLTGQPPLPCLQESAAYSSPVSATVCSQLNCRLTYKIRGE